MSKEENVQEKIYKSKIEEEQINKLSKEEKMENKEEQKDEIISQIDEYLENNKR